MSMQDSISDMLTRIRNSQKSNKITVSMPASRTKISIANLLKEEGFINNYTINNCNKPILTISLKYFQNKPVIEVIKRISRPGLRIYKKKNDLPRILSGIGIEIISTSKGIMTGKSAHKHGIGGEIFCYIA